MELESEFTNNILSVHHDPVEGLAIVSISDKELDLYASFDLTRDQALQVISELQKLTYVDFKIGDRVYWQDPDNNQCSGEYLVSDVTGTGDDLTIWLGETVDESHIQVFPHEITMLDT